jgi:hypothetical protein
MAHPPTGPGPDRDSRLGLGTVLGRPDVEVIPIQKVNEAYERLVKSDVKYRFSIDMVSLKSE